MLKSKSAADRGGCEQRSKARGTERNLECGLHIDGGAIFHGGLELPLRDCLTGELVEAVVDTADDAHVVDSAVGANDRVEDHGAGDVLAHELSRVGRIDFARGSRLGKISGGGVRVVIFGAVTV